MSSAESPWSWSNRRGVVVEHADWETGLAYASALREAGFTALVCPGPDARGLTGRCPLVEGEECSLVAGADVVVSALRTRHGREIAEALVTRGDRCVVVGDGADPTPRAVVRAVKRALAR